MKTFVLGVMMVPGMSMVVGIYSTLVSIHAISTYWGIIAVSAAFGLPVSIYMYSNFIMAIPYVSGRSSLYGWRRNFKDIFSDYPSAAEAGDGHGCADAGGFNLE